MVNPEEHDPETVTGIRLEESKLVSGLKDYWHSSVDTGNGSLILLHRDLFGHTESENLVRELRKDPYNAQIDFKNVWSV